MKNLLLVAAICGVFATSGCGGSNAITQHFDPLLITSDAPPFGTIGGTYSGGGFSLAASGGEAPYAWSWTAASGSSLPPGLSLANATISGTPTTQGTYNVVITVSDSQSPVMKTSNVYAITISVPQPLVITSGNPPDGIAGSSYNPHHCPTSSGNVACGGFQLFAIGGVQPYTWSWAGQSGSSTPPGLNIHWGGQCSSYIYHDVRIACVPTVAGTYNVTITATDSASPPNHVSNNYTINVANPPPPVINTIPAPSEGAIDLPYRFKFTATGGLAPLTWSQTGALPPGLNFATDGTLSGTPTAAGSFPIIVNVVDSLSRSAPSQDFKIQVAAHGFQATSDMSVRRVFHTATPLKDGKVFVAGGTNHLAINVPSGTLLFYSSTETYDPATRSFSPTANMSTPRFHHTATLLSTGKVLIAGGESNFGFITPTAEIYDPASNTFAPTSNNMTTPRVGHQATLLSSGKVLITGGFDGTSDLASAEIFDPNTGMFTRTKGDMHAGRNLHTQSLLNNGTALVAGGVDNANNTLGTAEIYDPVADAFSTPINMSAPRLGHTATLLNSGKVLLVGGLTTNTGITVLLASAEIFDPSKGTFTPTGSMANARIRFAAALLGDGTVLVEGGLTDTSPSLLALAELFDPASGKFTGTGSLF
ncbi:MAG TPA: kelch repeat-containing protein, partial [Candidatus Acidoferrum sp.]|nr:kelch repeat-containing protein [Candidatus Acidoferrum sp.]